MQVQDQGDQGAEQLQQAFTSLPPAVLSRYPDHSGLSYEKPEPKLTSLEVIQSCVALASSKREVVNEVEASLRREADQARAALPPRPTQSQLRP